MEDGYRVNGRHRSGRNEAEDLSRSGDSDDDELDRPEGGTGESGDWTTDGLDIFQDFTASRAEYIVDDEERYEPVPVLEGSPSPAPNLDGNESIAEESIFDRVDLSDGADYYSILALSRSPAPTSAQIRAAYHSLSLLFHPDKQPPHRRAMAEQHYSRIQRAYETLIDPHKRVVYDLLGEEGVRAEWGAGGAMGRSGEAEQMQVGVKTMGKEDFRQWLIAVMKRRERAVLQKLVNTEGKITLRVNAVPLFHPYLFDPEHGMFPLWRLFPGVSRASYPRESNAYPPLVQITNLNIRHGFSVSLPWLGRILDSRLPQWPGAQGAFLSSEAPSSNHHWSDAARDDVPELTITSGMGGNLIHLTPQVKSGSDGTEQSELQSAVPLIPAIIARNFSLGTSLKHTFPERSGLSSNARSIASVLQGSILAVHTIVLPQRVVQASVTRAITVTEGTRPLVCRLQTTFHDLPKRVPPTTDVQITRQLGVRQVAFCSWYSGSSLWPRAVAQLFQPFISLGVDPKVPYAIGGGTSSMSVGLKLYPAESPTEDVDDEADKKRPSAESKNAEGPHQTPPNRVNAQVSWDFQVEASPYGSNLSVVYGRDVFGKASAPPLQSEWTGSGDPADQKSNMVVTKGDRGLRLELQGTLGLDLSLSWMIKGTRQVGDFTSVGLGVGLQGARGLIVSVSWQRLGQNIVVPVAVCPAEILSRQAVMWALTVPWAAYVAIDYGFVRSSARRRRKEDRARRRKELRTLLDKRKGEAAEATSLMRDQVQRRQRRERNQAGLVILEAEYGVLQKRYKGKLDTTGEDLWKPGEVTDVTIALAALVNSGQLDLPGQIIKSQIPGFYDPAPLSPKVLRVHYLFADKEHLVAVADGEPLRCPMRTHELNV